MNSEFCDEPATVVASIDDKGEITPKALTWRKKAYAVTAAGRQWDETDGRHVLVEAGGTRFELQLRREDLVWRVRRVWWASTLV